jgi:hypothetical protein
MGDSSSNGCSKGVSYSGIGCGNGCSVVVSKGKGKGAGDSNGCGKRQQLQHMQKQGLRQGH